MIHSAHTYEWGLLYQSLLDEVSEGRVFKKDKEHLSLFCYTKQTVNSHAWNLTNVLARGLVLNVKRKTIAATPFKKFFNFDEGYVNLLSMSQDYYRVYPKLDGTLIIVFYDEDLGWQVITKGSWEHPISARAKELLFPNGQPVISLHKNITYLFEYIGPDNRVVVSYDEERLVAIGAYDSVGSPFDILTNQFDCEDLPKNIRVCDDVYTKTIPELIKEKETWGAEREGYVVHFEDSDLRFKIKGDYYLKVHRMMNGVTHKRIQELLVSGEDIQSFRANLPEECWAEFDRIKTEIDNYAWNGVSQTLTLTDMYGHLPQKEFAAKLSEYYNDAHPVKSAAFLRKKSNLSKEELLTYFYSKFQID